MRVALLTVLLFPFLACAPAPNPVSAPQPLVFPAGSWAAWLQHLPFAARPIRDYAGREIGNQGKHYAMLDFDAGHADLQQCADALMRLRAEYLFSAHRGREIGFHFQSGALYRWSDYREGLRPNLRGGSLAWTRDAPKSDSSHVSLRRYLDIVFAYANTVSLCRELPAADGLGVGTVIIWPGNPGHCSLVIDAAVAGPRDTVYRLAEGYMPAQGIYILANPYEPELNPWYHLHTPGPIATASCLFQSYFLRRFE